MLSFNQSLYTCDMLVSEHVIIILKHKPCLHWQLVLGQAYTIHGWYVCMKTFIVVVVVVVCWSEMIDEVEFFLLLLKHVCLQFWKFGNIFWEFPILFEEWTDTEKISLLYPHPASTLQPTDLPRYWKQLQCFHEINTRPYKQSSYSYHAWGPSYESMKVELFASPRFSVSHSRLPHYHNNHQTLP